MKRREFIKNTLCLAAASTFSQKTVAQITSRSYELTHDDLPIARVPNDAPWSSVYNGDNMDRPHDLLWDVPGYLRGKDISQAPTEEVDYVIVGGGVSGLSAAYYLRGKDFVLLEQDPRLGGNSKGEIYNNAVYSIGGAYLCEPSSHSNLGRILTDLDIWDHARLESGQDTQVFYNNLFKSPFWEGATDVSSEQFKKVHERFIEISNSADFSYEGPLAKATDSISAEEWLQNEFGDLHPHIKEYLQLYCWSSFCGSLSELSAFQFLGFITSETGNLMAFPGGNSYVALKMAENIRRNSGARSLRSNSIVLDIQNIPGGVRVLYEDPLHTLRVIYAKQAIVACPKYVARSIIPEMSREQQRAIQFLPYRAYLVGNLITRKSFTAPSFELYCLKGEAPPAPTPHRTGNRGFSDICFGTWAQHDSPENSVLTLYQGIPYDARQFLSTPGSHDKHRDLYLSEALPVLRALGLDSEDILGLRLSRWGHALPLAGIGMINDGTYLKVSQSVGSGIHFANQDNWMNPCFESAHQSAIQAVALAQTHV